MHASIDQLLEIKDGEPCSMRDHVSECEVCQKALAELHSFESMVGSAMIDAADKIPSDDAWNRIQQTLDLESELDRLDSSNVVSMPMYAAGSPAGGNNSLTKAVYSLAASIAFVGLIGVFMFSAQQNDNQQTLAMQTSINELMLNSRGLEHVLQQVAQQNQALSVANQQAADRLYWRLGKVDQLINQVSPENEERMEVLWSNRIDALNQLNQIYYQHEGTLDAPEI